jgi:hypothetical protein
VLLNKIELKQEEYGLKIPTPHNENDNKKKKSTINTNTFFDVDEEELEAAIQANADGMFGGFIDNVEFPY